MALGPRLVRIWFYTMSVDLVTDCRLWYAIYFVCLLIRKSASSYLFDSFLKIFSVMQLMFYTFVRHLELMMTASDWMKPIFMAEIILQVGMVKNSGSEQVGN